MHVRLQFRRHKGQRFLLLLLRNQRCEGLSSSDCSGFTTVICQGQGLPAVATALQFHIVQSAACRTFLLVHWGFLLCSHQHHDRISRLSERCDKLDELFTTAFVSKPCMYRYTFSLFFIYLCNENGLQSSGFSMQLHSFFGRYRLLAHRRRQLLLELEPFARKNNDGLVEPDKNLITTKTAVAERQPTMREK